MKLKNLKSVLAIDIDAESIKALVGHAAKGELIIKKAFQCKLPEQLFLDGKILNQSDLETILRDFIKSHKIKTKNCFVTMESSQMIARELAVPNRPGVNLQDLARYEVAQHLPIDIGNFKVQSKWIRDLEVEGKAFAEVYATAVPKLMVEQVAQMISNVGLKPLVFDTHGNALTKLVNEQGKINQENIEQKTVAFIEFGFESIYVSIIQKGNIRLNRMINMGSKDLDANLSRLLGIPVDDAKLQRLNINSLNLTTEVAAGDEARVINMMRSTMEGWLEEIDKLFRFHMSRNKNEGALEKVFVYGDLTSMKGFETFCSDYLRVSTERVARFHKISGMDEKEDVTKYIYALGALYRK